MAGINADQEKELTFLTGIKADGTLAAQSFWTWNRDTPATFNPGSSDELKWGAPLAGTGATINVAFDIASHWSAAEQGAFLSSMHLWSAVANITFNLTGTTADAQLIISRDTDDLAETRLTPEARGTIGTTQLGTMHLAKIQIDTSGPGFGPLGAGFAVAGGFPLYTALHEIGHAIGIGHGGTYNEGQTTSEQPYTPYDDVAWTMMSYIGPDDPRFTIQLPYAGYGNAPDGSLYMPQTLGPLDMLAAERIYGMPVNTPLSGGQVFGFHSNISGELGQYYDFTQNTHPIVTLWDAGGNNTLDLSGYSSPAYVDLHQGAFSTAGVNLSHNIAIAYGTRIDTYIGTGAYDLVVGNDDGDVLMGGGAADRITGGSGNDHIYGNSVSSVQGAADGADTIDAGDGSNYVNGNAGDDQIDAGWGTNRLYGGAGNDQIVVHGHGNSHINGNTGNDFLQTWGGTNEIHGGQGNDNIVAQGGTNFSFGDAGNDVISGGSGIDIMTGGAGADVFGVGAYQVVSSPLSYDEITDFTDGLDKIVIPTFVMNVAPTVLHGDGRAFGDIASAQNYATTLLDPTISVSSKAVAALQVGADTYLFFSFRGWPGDHVDSYAQVDHVDSYAQVDHVAATSINQDDLVWALSPL